MLLSSFPTCCKVWCRSTVFFKQESALGRPQSLRVLHSRNLREEHTRATAELARLSHTRRHLLSNDAGSQTLHMSQNAERKAASAALRGLCGTHFRQADFLDLVCLLQSFVIICSHYKMAHHAVTFVWPCLNMPAQGLRLLIVPARH